MSDFLDVLAGDAITTVISGYYEQLQPAESVSSSLKGAILQSNSAAVIAEVKGASPSKGIIRQDFSPGQVARAMVSGGAVGISVLTEPRHFHGSLNNIIEVRKSVRVPVLMKDIIVSPQQVEAASKLGANAVLLIQTIFDRGYCDFELSEMVAKAHSKGLEVLLEVHCIDEFLRACESGADMLGVNNRNLCTLKVDLNVTREILTARRPSMSVVVSESGIGSVYDVRFLKEAGADAFLIGSSVMSASCVEEKVREFVNAY